MLPWEKPLLAPIQSLFYLPISCSSNVADMMYHTQPRILASEPSLHVGLESALG